MLNSGVLFQNLYLQFVNEKELIINEIVKEIPQELRTRSFLDLAGECEYENLPLPFYWNFSLDYNWKEVLRNPSLKGIVFPYELLSRLNDQNIFLDFLKEFYEQLNSASRSDIDLILSMDWDSDVFPSLLDMMTFNALSLPVNSKIELAYRQLDSSKFQNSFHDFKESML